MFSSDPAPAAFFSDATPPAEDELAFRFQQARVLIVDDELANVRILERLISRAGVANFRSTTDSRQTLPLLQEFAPDILLLDLHMPHMDGFAVMRACRKLLSPETFLPILVLTADATSETKLRALDSGATDFLTKPLDHAEVLLRLRNLLHTRHLHCELGAQNAHLEETVRERTADLREALGELQEMQGHLVQQERLSAFGTMASGVAHDFNNALSLILGYSELLLADDGRLAREERQHFVRTVITAAKDSARMVSRLREFYRPNDKEVWEHVDFGQLVHEAVALTEPKWKGHAENRGAPVTIAFEVEPVPSIAGNAAELRELLTNLIFNAVDAMPEGGAITLRVRPEGEKVVVEVADSGQGMTEEVRRRCLEPFFTTKGEKGTGLGLAMVYGIIQRHHAELQLESTPGVGTTFRFRFAAEEKAAAVSQVGGAVRLARPLRILVADDQPFICEIMQQYLAQDCHQAEIASCGEEALELLRQGIFDVLITDQAMPGLTGGQVARQAKEIDPGLRVILLTGFGSDERPEEGAEAIDLVLGKPVALETLRHALAELSSGQPAAALSHHA